MRSDGTQLQGWLGLFTILAITCVLISLAACETMVAPLSAPAAALTPTIPSRAATSRKFGVVPLLGDLASMHH